MVYSDKIKKKKIHASWISQITREQQGKQQINQVPSQMPAQPAIADSYTAFTDKGEPYWLTSQCYDLWRIQI